MEGNAARIIGVLFDMPTFAKIVASKIMGLTSLEGDNVRTVSREQEGVETCDQTDIAENG